MSLVKYKYNISNSWNEIKNYCENTDLTISHFIYNGSNITIGKFEDETTLTIDHYTEQSIHSIINDLPQNITALAINISDTTKTKFLEKIMTNLPFGLKLVRFNYIENKLSKEINIKSDVKFNVLFGIKIPLNCGIVVNYKNVDYDVIYNDFNSGNDDKLELWSNEQTFKIKYIEVSYVPLKFWFNSNPGLALPQVALQYSDAKINIEFDNLEQIQ